MAKMTFEFLDVGMGDGTFVMMGDTKDKMQLAMIDFGVHRRTKHKIGRDDAIKYLVGQIDEISQARDKLTPYLDHLFLTHPDHDHYNAVMPLIEAKYPSYPGKKLQIGRLSYGGDADLYKGEIEKISAHVAFKKLSQRNVDDLPSLACSTVESGTVKPYWTFPGSKTKVYLLSANYPSIVSATPNPLSLCLMFADESDNKVILMGDAEKAVEQQIIENFKTAPGFLKSYALKLGHHGSEAGTSDEWLAAVQPKAIFASGDFVWAHPYCNTITRVQAKTKLATWNKNLLYCCGKSLGGRERDYFNNKTDLRICLNLWYVVKDDKGKMMTDEETGETFRAAYGLTLGVQWELEFNGALIELSKTDSATPDVV